MCILWYESYMVGLCIEQTFIETNLGHFHGVNQKLEPFF